MCRLARCNADATQSGPTTPTSSARRTRARARSRLTLLGESSPCTAELKCADTQAVSTGKRSKEGALQDGVNSITRYVRNNFFDGSRQDAYDLFTGAWTPRKGVAGDKRALLVRAVSCLVCKGTSRC